MTADDRTRPGGARTPRVFLVGYYGVGNLGDDAIRVAIERAAARLGVDIPFYADRGASQDPRAIRTGVRGLPAQIRAIRATDRVVLGGGGILKDEGLRLPAELLVTALIARSLRRPVTLLGVGVGPFYHRIGRWMVRAIARLSQVRTVRDESSVAALRELGVTRVMLAADPIFSTDSEPGLDPDGHDRPVTVPPAQGSPAATKSAIVSIRHWFHKVPGETDARSAVLRTGLATGLAPLQAAGWRIRLLPMYWPRDVEASRELVATMPLDAPAEVVDEALSWDGLVASVQGASLVIAMRYHAVAAAALSGRPIVAIAYEPKVAFLAAELGIPVIEVDAPDLGERLAALCASAVAGELDAGPDAAALDRLRQRAWSGLRAALPG